jgi:hypothetical protein
MATVESIMNRDAFGHWLSGFTDGEGCFFLGMRQQTPARPLAKFFIVLRADDKDVLVQIRSYLGVGIVEHRSREKRSSFDTKPQYVYRVESLADQLLLVKHFDAYPLRAKKARDFALWKTGVKLIASTSHRRWRRRPGKFDGFFPRYTEAELHEFLAIRDALREQRKYNSPDIQLPTERLDNQMRFSF